MIQFLKMALGIGQIILGIVTHFTPDNIDKVLEYGMLGLGTGQVALATKEKKKEK